MRVIILDDAENELAQGQVSDLTVNGETLNVDMSAVITASWHALPEGGQSASAGVAALMDHIVAQGKATVRYSRIKYSSGPAGHPSPAAAQAVGSIYKMLNP